MTRKRHDATEVLDAVPEAPPPDLMLTTDDLLWAIHGRLMWLTEEWARDTDARLAALEADTYDTADRVEHLAVLAVVVVLMLAGVGAIIVTLRYLG